MTDPLTDISRPMPFSNDAEEGILGYLLTSPHGLADAEMTLKTTDFYHPTHRLLFDVLLSFHRQQKLIDLVTVGQYFIDTKQIEKIGGPAWLAEIYSFASFQGGYDHYKRIVHNKAKLREIITACTDTIAKAYEYQDDVETFLAGQSAAVFSAMQQRETVGRQSFAQILDDYMAVYEARMKGEVETGIPTRWPSINAIYGGITPTMWLVSGYPSDGKSALVQNMAEDVLAAGHEVLYFLYEMGNTEMVDRFVVAKSQVESKKVFAPNWNAPNREDQRDINRAIGDMYSWKLHLRYEPTWTIEQIVSETRVMMQKHPGIKLVIADYLQLIPTAKDFGAKRSDQVAYISRTWKREVSAANNVAAVMLSQLNDDGKTLDSRAPGQDSSNMLGIEEHGLRAIKNRNGRRGELLPIRLNGGTFSFVEGARTEPEAGAETKKRTWTKRKDTEQ